MMSVYPILSILLIYTLISVTDHYISKCSLWLSSQNPTKYLTILSRYYTLEKLKNMKILNTSLEVCYPSINDYSIELVFFPSLYTAF